MPSVHLGEPAADIVLGDRFGRAAHPEIVRCAHEVLAGVGLRVGRNRPYAGGYITEHYGRPADGVSALQLEFRRSLFLDEATMEARPGLGGLPELMCRLVQRLADVVAPCRYVPPPMAALIA